MSRQIGSESLPILPILDTEEILRGMGEEWKVQTTDRHGINEVDDILLEWIRFCESAKKGEEIREQFKKGYISGDIRSLRSRRVFEESLRGEDVSFPDIITTIESAFAQLLSSRAIQKIPNIQIEPELTVDNKLRKQIGVLVKNMYPITQSYIYERQREWREIYGDD